VGWRRILSVHLLSCLALVCLGCVTVLDVEGIAQVLKPERPPETPALSNARSARLVAPEGLRARSDELRAIPLKWDPVLAGRVGGYVVERAASRKKADYQRVAILPERFATSFVDRGTDLAPKATPRGRSGVGDLGDGTTYFYRVRAFDDAGRISRFASEVVSATTHPPPPRPEDLRTYSHRAHKIALTWRPVEDETVAGYLIHRSPSSRGDYHLVARVDGRFNTTWVDWGLEPLRVLYYRVVAVNRAGGEGLPSHSRRGVTKPEPLPPHDLEVAEQQLGSIRLAWVPNVESNIAGYRLFRQREKGESEELVTELGREQTSAVDEKVGAGESLTYHAVAFDSDGLVSASSEPVRVRGVGYGLEAKVRGGRVELRWDERLHERFGSARVLRDGFFGARQLAEVPRPFYSDEGVARGRTYRYRVILLRDDDTEAPPSAYVEVSVPR
jgi:fibronectin type 3 domain-containing protein